MNSAYIGIGVAIILALVAALVGPLFVDWSAHRAVFEREASRIVGAPVTVLGDVDARLLPSPRVRFGDVVVGDVARPLARVGRFELDLDVAALTHGDVRVAELVLERPGLDLAIDADGRVVGLPAGGGDLAGVGIETARIVDGTLRLADRRSGRQESVTAIAGRGRVEGKGGQWRLDVEGDHGGRHLRFEVAARPDGVTTRLRALVASPAEAASVVFLGAIEGADRPKFVGTVSAERRDGGAVVASASGRIEADVAGAKVEDLALTLGTGGDETKFSGRLAATFGKNTAFEAMLATPRIDLDRGATGGGARARVAGLAERLGGPEGAVVLPAGLRLTLGVDALTLGGRVLSDVSVEARGRPGGVAIDRLAARLPGGGRLDISGRLDPAAPSFDGTGTLAVAEPEDLAAWWAGEAVGTRRIGAIEVTGPFVLSRDGFFGRDLEIAAGAERARGRVERRADGLTRLGLVAERLDGRRLFGLAAAATAAGGAPGGERSIDVDLDVASVTLGSATARGVRAGLRIAPGEWAIDRLAVTDLLGAKLEAGGRIADPFAAPRGRIEAKLSATDAARTARALAAAFAPDAADPWEAAGAAAGSLDLDLVIEGAGAQAGSRVKATLAGRAAGGRLAGDLDFEGRPDDVASGRIDGRLTLSDARLSREATKRFGLSDADGIRLAGTIAGRPSEGLRFSLDAGFGDRRLTLEGHDGRDASGVRDWTATGRLASPDLAVLGALVGRPGLAFERRLPVDVTASIRGRGGQWRVEQAEGTVVGVHTSARGLVDTTGVRPKFSGDVAIDRGEAATLLFGLAGLPFDLEATARVATLDVGEAFALTGLAGRVSSADGSVRLADLAAARGPLALSGGFEARRSGDGLALSGRIAGEGLSFVAGTARPGLEGRISGEIAFETHGASGRDFVARAGGSGRLTLSAARLLGVDPAATAHRPAGPTLEPAEALAAMKGRATAFEATDVPLLLDGGQLRLPRVDLAADAVRIGARAGLDVATGRLDGQIAVEPAGEAAVRLATPISRAVPAVDVVLGGTVLAPLFSIDEAPLAAHLLLERTEREIEASDVERQGRIERLRARSILEGIEARRRAREAAEAAKVAPPAGLPEAKAPVRPAVGAP